MDDGKHRVLAAKELGLKVPVQIANDQAPSNVQSAAPVGKSAAQIRGERFQDSLLSFPSQTASNAASNSADSDSRPGVPERERDIVAERQSDGWERGAALQKPTASANRELHGRTSETGENLRGNYTVVDPNTGTVTSNGNLEITKGNHKGMPSRTSAYLPGDERGHIQASSLGGSNDPSNIVPQHHDVNRYGWRGMERGETDALKMERLSTVRKSLMWMESPETAPRLLWSMTKLHIRMVIPKMFIFLFKRKLRRSSGGGTNRCLSGR